MNKEFSYWEAAHVIGEIDTLIVGGGIVGLSAALRRKEMDSNERIAIVERDAICGGGSTKNAGFACFGSPSELLHDLKSMSREEVVELIRTRWRGLQGLRKLIGDREMEYRQTGGIELFREQESSLGRECLSSMNLLNTMMEEATGQSPFELLTEGELQKFGFSGFELAIDNTLEGSINTGKMYAALHAKASEAGVLFLNGLAATGFDTGKGGIALHTHSGTLHASRLLISTNGFARELLPDLDVLAGRNLVLLTEPIPEIQWEGTFHMQEGHVYFRNVGNRLLIGGARHLDRSWNDVLNAPPREVQDYLEALLEHNILPSCSVKISHRWTGYLGLGQKKTVLSGVLTPQVAYAVRMGGMGIAIGNAVGSSLADMIE